MKRRGIRAHKAGAGPKGSDFADRVSGKWVVEEKETIKREVPLRDWWEKVEREAARIGRHASIVLTLKRMGRLENDRVAIIPYYVFLQLLGDSGGRQ